MGKVLSYKILQVLKSVWYRASSISSIYYLSYLMSEVGSRHWECLQVPILAPIDFLLVSVPLIESLSSILVVDLTSCPVSAWDINNFKMNNSHFYAILKNCLGKVASSKVNNFNESYANQSYELWNCGVRVNDQIQLEFQLKREGLPLVWGLFVAHRTCVDTGSPSKGVHILSPTWTLRLAK